LENVGETTLVDTWFLSIDMGEAPECRLGAPVLSCPTQIRWFSSDTAHSINLLTYLLTR